MKKITIILIFFSATLINVCSKDPGFITNENEIKISLDNQTILKSPQKGLWALSTEWEDKWMAQLYYGNPKTKEIINNTTILKGKIKTPKGEMHIRDAYTSITENLIKCIRRFEWHGSDTLKKCNLAIQFECPATGNQVVMPGVVYHGNPSGAKSSRTPIYKGQNKEQLYVEEHRLPMPFVSFEFQASNKKLYGACIHTLPSKTPNANINNQWWSLGLETTESSTILGGLSGPCAMNNRKSVIKVRQGKKAPMFEDYDNTYLNLPPGSIIEKTFYIESYPVKSKGSGFQTPIHTSITLFPPYSSDMPTINEIVEKKITYAQTRWIENGKASGYNQFTNDNKKLSPFFVIGWVGQAITPGYAMLALKDKLTDKDAIKKAIKSLDFISTTEFYKDGFYTWYNVNEDKWQGRIWKPMPELLSQGQGMLNMANAINAGKRLNVKTKRWENFLKEAADFHSERILKEDWHPSSTNEAFFIAPLCRTAELFSNEQHKKAAIKAANHYADRHKTMEEPYWGGTLDASCEDKEGAWAAFQGFLELYELTNNPKHLTLAQHAADVVLSYMYVWDVNLPAGRLTDHNFKTRGWTAVSVQNMHIDVFGVVIAPYFYRLGNLTNNQSLRDVALLMYKSCGQLIDPYGSQGEQPQQTNFSQSHHGTEKFEKFQGGYVEDWTVFWITAHFLNAAAQFKELGIDVSQ